MQDCMLDLETMGTAPDSAIISIGAVMFDPLTMKLGAEFHKVISLQSCAKRGRKFDPSTILWWLEQSDEARSALTKSGVVHELGGALGTFSDWICRSATDPELGPTTVAGTETVRMWGNGAGFDNVLLEESYKACGLPVPWKFYNNRCYRTVKALRPDIKLVRTGTHHNALDDAKSQALHLMKILEAMRHGQ